jgi:hypothetical protein
VEGVKVSASAQKPEELQQIAECLGFNQCGAQEFCPQGLSLRNNAPKVHNPSFLEIIVG